MALYALSGAVVHMLSPGLSFTLLTSKGISFTLCTDIQSDITAWELHRGNGFALIAPFAHHFLFFFLKLQW